MVWLPSFKILSCFWSKSTFRKFQFSFLFLKILFPLGSWFARGQPRDDLWVNPRGFWPGWLSAFIFITFFKQFWAVIYDGHSLLAYHLEWLFLLSLPARLIKNRVNRLPLLLIILFCHIFLFGPKFLSLLIQSLGNILYLFISEYFIEILFFLNFLFTFVNL